MPRKPVTTSQPIDAPINFDEYDQFIERFQQRFSDVSQEGQEPLFMTDAADLWRIYLDAIPESRRQHYTCHACRQFIERFGGLVTIDEQGMTHPVFWEESIALEELQPAMRHLAKAVRQARVVGVFYHDKPVWGRPVTGVWHHMAVRAPSGMVYRAAVKAPDQEMAEKREDFRTLMPALAEFSKTHLATAVTLLKSDALYRSEKCLGVAAWLSDLQERRATVSGRAKDHIVWKAVATAPAGYCHPRSSMIGTLLEDIQAGYDYETISRRFAAKMHPLKYQRPTVVKEGNIGRAEQLVEKLGIASALRRRYAKIEEIPLFWSPTPNSPEPSTSGGVFDHLRQRQAQENQLKLPEVTITWKKFSRTVLLSQQVSAMHLYADTSRRDSYAALVTAVDPDAPPIVQWDQPEQRNPFSWYLYAGGSLPQYWNVSHGFVPVTGITFLPFMWYGQDTYTHYAQGVLFILQDAKDRRTAQLCVFPEILKAELREVRSTIEAYSKSRLLEGGEEASACGLLLQKGRTWRVRVRVQLQGQPHWHHYLLDRWD